MTTKDLPVWRSSSALAHSRPRQPLAWLKEQLALTKRSQSQD